MSVVVRMEMPKNNCEMAVEIKGVGDWCPIAARVCDYYSTKKMPNWCPIICSLPEGHGRLMDADAFISTIRPLCEEDKFAACTFETVKRLMVEHINNAPTIVPRRKVNN